ncbi:glucose/arabinose dehydrogenase [Paenarthrobacter nitroguajacolicus]|nr:glucose/arabinose dehydrogenase [Paenarthrobacter nitroguajacolicus]
MRARRGAMALLLVAGSIGLAACAGNPNTGSIQSTAPTPTKTQEEPMKAELTWQEAKVQAQAMELEIAALIPKDAVISIDQKKKGMLLSCNKAQHKWKGSTTITVAEGTNIEPMVKDIEAHYQGGLFGVRNRLDIRGSYEVQMIARSGSGENYIVAEGLAPNQIDIDSGSPCFTLPEGIYAGGDF